jgi:tetratricopeptide (TPR) repeat protein
MHRLRVMFVSSVLALCALSLPAQTQPQDRPNDQPNMQQEPAPERVAPPSPAASAQQLEEQGDILRARKFYVDAIDYYHVAQQKSDSATLHNKIGICFIQLQRYADSRKEFEKATKMNPEYAEAFNNLGAANYQMRRFSVAVKFYQKAIKLDEPSAHFHFNLASAYFSRKDFDRASHEYQRALQLDPSIFDPQAGGGISVKLATQTQSDRAYFHYMIAKMYGSRGDKENCRLYLAKANEAGYPYIKDALKDGEFAQMRKDPSFVQYVRSLKKPTEGDE